MLRTLPTEKLRYLREYFENAGYVEANLRKHLGAPELLSNRLRNGPRLLRRTAEPTLLNLLLRWFWLGTPQTVDAAKAVASESLLQLLIESGLLVRQGNILAAEAMLLPFDDFLVASDHPSAIERGDSEMVLWPNPTSKFLARFAVRRHSRATLDLGTGSGILSLGAAAHSEAVVATDLNLRAVSFAAFNAKLNGSANIEVMHGDRFEPVSGRTFDLILSNPPFFITPNSDYLFCDNSLELDQLCRQLVGEAPSHLNEGGYMQMLCEWAQVSGQPWEERIAEWLDGTGCDAWVMKGLTQSPDDYAQHRISETTDNTGRDAELFDNYMSYYRQRGVEAIHDGLIVLRKRNGHNWVRIEEVPKTPTGNMGEVILSTFAAHDWLREMESDEKMLAIRPKLSEHVRLEQICAQGGGGWHAESLSVRLITGFPFQVTVQPLVADFLAMCDGNCTCEQAIRTFADSANAPIETVQRECLAMIRKLVERGFILVAVD